MSPWISKEFSGNLAIILMGKRYTKFNYFKLCWKEGLAYKNSFFRYHIIYFESLLFVLLENKSVCRSLFLQSWTLRHACREPRSQSNHTIFICIQILDAEHKILNARCYFLHQRSEIWIPSCFFSPGDFSASNWEVRSECHLRVKHLLWALTTAWRKISLSSTSVKKDDIHVPTAGFFIKILHLSKTCNCFGYLKRLFRPSRCSRLTDEQKPLISI